MLDTDLLIPNNKQSYWQLTGSKKVMSNQARKRIRGIEHDNIFSTVVSMIADGSMEQMMRQNAPNLSSLINDILNPSSIFGSGDCQRTLDDYLKIKTKDKPKDTLRQIQQKKQAFIRYIRTSQLQCPPLQTQSKQNLKNQSGRTKEQFSEFTFYKNCKENMLLFIRITETRRSKCNISVANLRGQIVKYYPNVFVTKKQGKLIKLIAQYKNCFIFVYDYTKVESTIKTFPSLLNQSTLLYYEIIDINIDNHQILPLAHEKIQASGKGHFQYGQNKIILMSNDVKVLRQSELMQNIFIRIQKLNLQEQQFLSEFRGRKVKYDCNLAFDMMAVNLWRQFKWIGQMLANKIIQLFVLKESEMNAMVVDDYQALHIPKRLTIFQNCILCLSRSGETKRPRRTTWICSGCSVQKEKPIYLCKECFKDYHTDGSTYLYRKNEKKTKKFKRLVRLRKMMKKREQNIIKKEAQNIPKQKITQSELNIMDLDRKCDEFFAKIDELIEEKSFASSQFYLQMLMNMTILKNAQFLRKLEDPEPKETKMEDL